MRRREFIALIGGAATWPLSANAQTPAIGFLSSRSPRDSLKVVAAFGQGLGELGFIEGKNLSIEYRYAEGALDRLPEMAADQCWCEPMTSSNDVAYWHFSDIAGPAGYVCCRE